MKTVKHLSVLLAVLLTVSLLAVGFTVHADDARNTFSEGSITQVDIGSFTVDTDDYSAFISTRSSSADQNTDYRFVIAADIEKFSACQNLNFVLSFVKGEATVASLEKNVLTDLKVFASATAAGNTYVAADGVLLTGIVIKNVPAEAWDTATLSLVDGKTVVATGSVTAAEVQSPKKPLPLSGIQQLTVDTESVKFSVDCWAANIPAHAFDGETVLTKLGTPNAAYQPVTLEFSLTEPETVTWYTFWTGNDTIPIYSGRNPMSWVLYGKVNNEWVVLSEVTDPGMVEEWATPYSYAVANPTECKDYKIVFETSSGIFQLNEIELYKNDATVTTPYMAAIMEQEDAEVIWAQWYGYNADFYRIRTTFNTNKNQFSVEALAQVNEVRAFAWVKNLSTGEMQKYEIGVIEAGANGTNNQDLNFILTDFVPVAGTSYEFAFFFYSGDLATLPNALHVLHMFYTIPQ